MVLKDHEQEGGGSIDLAGAYANVGNKETALEWLEKSFEERDPNITLVKYAPEFKLLREDPRFSALLKRIGLPE